MKCLLYWGTLICLLATTQMGASQSAGSPQVVNLMVDYYMPSSADDQTKNDATMNLMLMMDQFSNKRINMTLFLTQAASKGARGFATQQGLLSNVELAMSGINSDEKLSSRSFAEQKATLESSKKYAELCNICGVNEIKARGFMPQSFDQNQDTYRVLDALGIEYNAGFKAGILSAPGHENDVWPYKVENHKFYAVPVSTTTLSGEKVALDDREMKGKGVSGSQWKDLLVGKFDEIDGKDEPMVVSLSTSVSGSGDYLDAFIQFLDYAVSKNAIFVKTNDLVNMSRRENSEAPALQSAEASSPASGEEAKEDATEEIPSDCPTCDAAKNSSMKMNGHVVGNMTFGNMNLNESN